MIAMWWVVEQVSPREVHVYPLAEQAEHRLDSSCLCHPEVKQGTGARMVVHRKLGTLRPAHWIQVPQRN